MLFLFFKQKTAYEMRISDWSSDVCSSDLRDHESYRAVDEFQRCEKEIEGDRDDDDWHDQRGADQRHDDRLLARTHGREADRGERAERRCDQRRGGRDLKAVRESARPLRRFTESPVPAPRPRPFGP